jgi:hypothetical protein
MLLSSFRQEAGRFAQINSLVQHIKRELTTKKLCMLCHMWSNGMLCRKCMRSNNVANGKVAHEIETISHIFNNLRFCQPPQPKLVSQDNPRSTRECRPGTRNFGNSSTKIANNNQTTWWKQNCATCLPYKPLGHRRYHQARIHPCSVCATQTRQAPDVENVLWLANYTPMPMHDEA